MSSLDIDLSLFRPVYAPKDFLEILSQVPKLNFKLGPVATLKQSTYVRKL